MWTLNLTLGPANPVSTRSFWLVMSALLGVGAVLGAVFLPLPWLTPSAAAGGAGAVYLTGRLAPESVRRWVFRAWNGLARRLCKHGSAALLTVCFYTLSAAAAKGPRAKLVLRDPGQASLWMKRESLPAESYGSQHAGPENERGPLGALFGWARKSGNLWVVTLLPYLVALTVLETPDDRDVPADIYTLF